MRSSDNIGNDIAQNLLDNRNLLKIAQSTHSQSDWEKILTIPDFWSIRHEKHGHSVCFMTAKAIEQSLIEDLLFVYVEKQKGAFGCYPQKQAYRHLGSVQSQIPRIQFAIGNLIDRGHVFKIKSNLLNGEFELILNSAWLKEAQDFSGVIIEDMDDDSDDAINDIISVGGKSLLGDVISEIIDNLFNDE